MVGEVLEFILNFYKIYKKNVNFLSELYEHERMKLFYGVRYIERKEHYEKDFVGMCIWYRHFHRSKS